MDIGGIVPTVDVGSLSLDVALSGLGMLSTVTNARQEYLNEMRLGRVRSLSCSLWRTTDQIGTSRSTNGPPTKENFQGIDPTLIYSVNSSHLNKMLPKRSRKNRISPYCRRKPLNILIGSTSCRSSSGTGSPTTSLSSEEGDRGLTPITQLFQEHLNLQQTHHTLPNNPNLQVHRTSSDITRQHCSKGPKLKTDGENFTVPVLTRSKSLEDLRESVKPKTKSFSSYVCGFGDASSPTFNRENSEVLTFSHGHGHRRHPDLHQLARLSLDSQNIKTEIDSMSMRIQKLDVA